VETDHISVSVTLMHTHTGMVYVTSQLCHIAVSVSALFLFFKQIRKRSYIATDLVVAVGVSSSKSPQPMDWDEISQSVPDSIFILVYIQYSTNYKIITHH